MPHSLLQCRWPVVPLRQRPSRRLTSWMPTTSTLTLPLPAVVLQAKESECYSLMQCKLAGVPLATLLALGVQEMDLRDVGYGHPLDMDHNAYKNSIKVSGVRSCLNSSYRSRVQMTV